MTKTAEVTKNVPPVKTDRFGRKKPTIHCTQPTKTQQHLAESTSIKAILKRYRNVNDLRHAVESNPGLYGDFSDAKSYQDSLNVVLQANDQFASLPSEVRERFQNDPAQFLEFASDEKNLPEMVKMGLANKRDELNDANEKTAPKKTKAEPKSSDVPEGSKNEKS